jgi:phosphate uptake regulator
MEKEVRKVQKSASGSFFITLPKSWVKEVGLKEGGGVEMTVGREKNLRILAPKTQSKSLIEHTMDLDEYGGQEPTLLERYIKNCYMGGIDVIEIVSKKTIPAGLKKHIKDVTLELIGVEIEEEFSNRIKIRVLVDAGKFPLHNLIKKMHVLVLSMQQDAVASLRNNNPEMVMDVINREKETEKLYRLITRQLTIAIYDRDVAVAIGVGSVIRGAIWAVIARDLSRIGFYAADIAVQASNITEKKIDNVIMGSLITASEVVKGMQEEAVAAFFKNDFSLANLVIDKRERITSFNRDIIEKILKREKDTETALALTAISRDISRIGSYTATIAEDTQMGSIIPALHQH